MLREGVRHAHAFNRLLRHAIDHDGRLNAGRFKDRRHDVDHVVELRADPANVRDVARPGNGHALPGAAEVRRDLLGPFERRIECPGPAHRHMRCGQGRTPDVIELQLVRDWNVDTLDRGHIDRGTDDGSFGAGAVVTADKDDQRVVELALGFDFLNDPADFMVGVGRIGCKNVGLTDEKLLLVGTQRVPFLKLRSTKFGLAVRPRRELCIRRNYTEPLLVGEDGLQRSFSQP